MVLQNSLSGDIPVSYSTGISGNKMSQFTGGVLRAEKENEKWRKKMKENEIIRITNLRGTNTKFVLGGIQVFYAL